MHDLGVIDDEEHRDDENGGKYDIVHCSRSKNEPMRVE
jgi:hypothetical protein